jgi:hypothetical protein
MATNKLIRKKSLLNHICRTGNGTNNPCLRRIFLYCFLADQVSTILLKSNKVTFNGVNPNPQGYGI